MLAGPACLLPLSGGDLEPLGHRIKLGKSEDFGKSNLQTIYCDASDVS